jgi:hypothetical protein
MQATVQSYLDLLKGKHKGVLPDYFCPDCGADLRDNRCHGRVKTCKNRVQHLGDEIEDEHRFPKDTVDGICDHCGGPTCPDCETTRKCARTRVHGFNVCQVHGAASPKARGTKPGGPIKHGRYSKKLGGLGRDLLADYETAKASGELFTINREVALMEMLIADALEQLSGGNRDKLWGEALTCMDNMDFALSRGDKKGAEYHHTRLRQTLIQGASLTDARRQVQSLAQTKTRMVDTERKYRLQHGLTLTVEEHLTQLRAILAVFLSHVKDEQAIIKVRHAVQLMLEGKVDQVQLNTHES